MIFVTVGTYDAPFDRLLEALASLPPGEELVVQHGSSAVRPAGAQCFDFGPFDDVVAHVRAARVVIAHAGVGSVMIALANGRRPVVMPRLGRFGETSDDHQLAFARRLAEAGLVRLVEHARELADAVAEDAAAPQLTGSGRLGAALRAELAR
jgi:UDP-N-acetylglucosamine transferase subunit ALG13